METAFIDCLLQAKDEGELDPQLDIPLTARQLQIQIMGYKSYALCGLKPGESEADAAATTNLEKTEEDDPRVWEIFQTLGLTPRLEKQSE